MSLIKTLCMVLMALVVWSCGSAPTLPPPADGKKAWFQIESLWAFSFNHDVNIYRVYRVTTEGNVTYLGRGKEIGTRALSDEQMHRFESLTRNLPLSMNPLVPVDAGGVMLTIYHDGKPLGALAKTPLDTNEAPNRIMSELQTLFIEQ